MMTNKNSKNIKTVERANKKRHYFFLNPYKNEAFTRCPQCEEKTKVRKYPLVIHVEPRQLLCLNISCKYCEACDLIIGKKSAIENLMCACCEKIDSALIGNEYIVFGTFDKSDWRQYNQTTTYPEETIDKVYIFKDVIQFELGGWVKDNSLSSMKES